MNFVIAAKQLRYTMTAQKNKTTRSKLTRNEKKEWAKTLYLQGDLTQKEISLKVDITEATVSSWVNANDREWEKMRKTLLMSKQSSIRRLYDILEKITISMEQNGGDPKQADSVAKITAAIKNLEVEMNVAEISEVARHFINYLQTMNPAFALQVGEYFDLFIKSRLKRF